MSPPLSFSENIFIKFSFIKKEEGCDGGMCSHFFLFLHYNYGLEGYQLNVSNYGMLQNWNIKLRLLF